jgi:hypothetical protein
LTSTIVLVGSLVDEELGARRDDLLELADVGRVDDDRHDVLERAARGLEHRTHVADALARLLRHVAGADELAVGVARELARQGRSATSGCRRECSDGRCSCGRSSGWADRRG